MSKGLKNHLPPFFSKVHDGHTPHTRVQLCWRALREIKRRCTLPPGYRNASPSESAVGWEPGTKKAPEKQVARAFPFRPENQSKADKRYRAKHCLQILQNDDSCTKLLTGYVHAKRKTMKENTLWVYKEQLGYTVLTIISSEEKMLNCCH